MEELINAVRNYIGDMTSPFQYDDVRLTSLILVAARRVNTELGFSYTITTDISPTPDDAFFNLVSLKAACILAFNEARASGGITRLKQGNNDISVNKSAFLPLWERGYCDDYEVAKLDYKMGISNPGAILIGPRSYYNKREGYRGC